MLIIQIQHKPYYYNISVKTLCTNNINQFNGSIDKIFYLALNYYQWSRITWGFECFATRTCDDRKL